MSTAPSITNANDAKLVSLIDQAAQRVVLLIPGASEEVARSLASAWLRLGGPGVTVILDVDPEVCRLGYGTLEGLQIVREAAAEAGTIVCHQPGVRIGLLISDNTTLVFSPAPLLIEAGSMQPQRPNAIQLETVPNQVAKDLGLGEHGHLKRAVGLDPVKPDQVEAVAQDLRSAPPVKFDLARRVRVFTSRFQFVDLEMTGCYVSRKKVPIPSRLVGLAKNQDIQAQFHAHFNLVNKGKLEVRTRRDRVITEDSLQKLRQEIVRDYLITIKGYGSVALRANKDKLLKAVRKLRAAVKVFQKGITQNLQQHMDSNAKALVEALLLAVASNPPDAYTKFHGSHITESQVRQLLEADIKEAFGQAEDLVQEMKVSLVFKDVAYESLVDKKFLEVARHAMPGVEFLHEEYDAAQAVT